MHKVQLTLTPEEVQVLSIKAKQLGYNVTKFIKLLIGKEVLSLVERYPTFQLTQGAKEKVEQAHREHKSGATVSLGSVDELDML